MNIGKLRYRVEVLDKVNIKDNEGNVDEHWSPIGRIWTGVSSRSGALTQKEYGLELSMVKEIVTRPSCLLLEGRKIVFDGKTYLIMHIDRMQGKYVSVIQLVGESL